MDKFHTYTCNQKEIIMTFERLSIDFKTHSRFSKSGNIFWLQETFPSVTYRRQLQQLQRLRKVIAESGETEYEEPGNILFVTVLPDNRKWFCMK